MSKAVHHKAAEEKPEEPTISKMEAVRRTLADGIEGTQEGIEYAKGKYGLDINATTWASYKSQIKNKPGAKGRSESDDVWGCIEGVRKLIDQYGTEAVRRSLGVLAD